MTKKIILGMITLFYFSSLYSAAQENNTTTELFNTNDKSSLMELGTSTTSNNKGNIITSGLNGNSLKNTENTSSDSASVTDLAHIRYVDSTIHNIGNNDDKLQQISVDMAKIKQNPVVSMNIQIVQKYDNHNRSQTNSEYNIVKLDSSLVSYSGMPNGFSYEAPNRLINPIIQSNYLESAPNISNNIHNNTLLDNTIAYSLSPRLTHKGLELNGVINFYIISANDNQVAENHKINVNALILKVNETKRIDLNGEYPGGLRWF